MDLADSSKLKNKKIPFLAKKTLSVGIVIPIGGSRVKDLVRLKECVTSLLAQDYQGEIKVILVVDPDSDLLVTSFPPGVELVTFVRPPHHRGRDTSNRLLTGWKAAQTDLLSMTGLSMVWPQDLIRRAIELMRVARVEAIDGVSEHMPEDKGFLAEFQDKALISEFPKYKRTFILSQKTFGQEQRMPSLTSFFMTQEMFQRGKKYLPIYSEHGWDDYNIVRTLIETAGEEILCCNELVSYRNHKVSLRLEKHFTSGSSSMFFYLNYPQNKYAQKRIKQNLLVFALVIYSILFTLILGGIFGVGFLYQLLFGAGGVFFSLGLYNVLKTKNKKALFFPFLMAIQILTYTTGAIYTGITEFNPDQELMTYLHTKR